MGADKASLLLDGIPLIEHICRAVRRAAGSVRIAGGPARPGYEVIADAAPSAGPLAGLVAALEAARAEWNLIVACDMPGVSAEFLAALLAEAEAHDAAVVPVTQAGRMHPLCAIYRRRDASILREALERGELRVLDAMELLPAVRRYPAAASIVENVNTPGDWKRVRP